MSGHPCCYVFIIIIIIRKYSKAKHADRSAGQPKRQTLATDRNFRVFIDVFYRSVLVLEIMTDTHQKVLPIVAFDALHGEFQFIQNARLGRHKATGALVGNDPTSEKDRELLWTWPDEPDGWKRKVWYDGPTSDVVKVKPSAGFESGYPGIVVWDSGPAPAPPRDGRNGPRSGHLTGRTRRRKAPEAKRSSPLMVMMTEGERSLLIKTSERTGRSMSRLLVEGFRHALDRGWEP